MLKYGDKLFIMDNSMWESQKKIKILESSFLRYDGDYIIMQDNLIIQPWAVSVTNSDARKKAMIYMIKNHLNQSIQSINLIDYDKFQYQYPELILDCIDRIA